MLKNLINYIYFKCRIITYYETNPLQAIYFNPSSAGNNVIVYKDVLNSKTNILQDNKQKSGVYKRINKVDGKFYIGRSINFSIRFSHYLSNNYLVKRSLVYKSKIYNTLLAHGHDNFCLEIL